jgi:hypothetical protein
MGRMNNIIHRRRAARNAVKDARNATGTPVVAEEAKAPKKRRWTRKKKA